MANTHILPPAVQHENDKPNIRHSEAITAFKRSPGRCHRSCGKSGWEEVADFALAWTIDPKPSELDG